jgi:signal transduction histidine kinase
VSIRLRLLLAVTLVLIGAFSIVAGVTLRISVTQESIQTLHPPASLPTAVVSRVDAFGRAHDGFRGADTLLSRLSEEQGNDLIVVDRSHHVAASSVARLRAAIVEQADRGHLRLRVLAPDTGVSGRFEVVGIPSAILTSLGKPTGTLYALPRAAADAPVLGLVEQRRDFDRRFLLWLALVALAAVALMLWISDRIVGPIRTLTAAVGDMASGSLQGRVDVRSNDEVGELARAFNELAERLERSETQRKALVADIAHELRTPLTNIRGSIESLQDGLVAASPEELRALHDDTLLLARLVDDLHELSVGDLGALRLETDAVDLDAEVRRAIDAFGEAITARQMRVRISIAQPLPHARGDAGRIRQVMHNLFSNALRYTDDGGTIDVAARRDGEEIRVSVSDDGVGFPAHEADAIFQRFHRVDASRSRATGGTGLGLAIAKQLIEAHGGNIGAFANDPRGATFWFTLPADAHREH